MANTSHTSADVSTSSPELPRKPDAKRVGGHENPRSPVLSSSASALLAAIPARRFFAPGGKRASGQIPWERQGFLDLYSGKAEVARQISKQFNVWVLTFDFTHGEDQNLLDVDVQSQIRQLVTEGAVLGIGAAPECGSFSRAVTPAVRDRSQPLGKDHLTARMAEKVKQGNQHAAFVLSLVLLCIELGLVYWVENPDGSFLWSLPDWLACGVCCSGEVLPL